jgi:outer membrane scaffolding protein for murein synthesis (MipA/OmpV family)
VRHDEATPGRPAYVGHDTVNYTANGGGEYRISRDWSLPGTVRATHFGDGIADSPIVSHRGSKDFFFGAGWRF